MTKESKKRDSRERILDALRRELLGPSQLDETLREFPTTRYLVGRLAPATDDDEGADPTDPAEKDGQVDPLENDTLGAGIEGDEDGSSEFQPPLIVGFHPSSCGLSFLISPEVDVLNVNVTWGDYRREKDEEEGGTYWQRYPQNTVVEGIPVNATGALPQVPLSPKSAPPGVTVTGTDDEELTLEGVVHDIDGDRAISLFLVNRRTRGKVTDKNKDERWVLQPRLEIFTPSDEAVFRAKRFDAEDGTALGDDEVAIGNLLYRHAREFATGHGVAAGWDKPTEDGQCVQRIFTDFIPDFEVPSLIAPADTTGGAKLDMYELSQAKSPAQLAGWLEPMLDAYDAWTSDRKAEATKPPISNSTEYTE